MAPEKEILIQKLGQVIDIIRSQKKQESLSNIERSAFLKAVSIFGEEYHFKDGNYSLFLALPITVVQNYIDEIKKSDQEQESKKEKPKEPKDAIPKELEEIVAEYEANKAELESEENTASERRSVAIEVKIAFANAQRNRSLSSSDQKLLDTAIIKFASPKSNSIEEALANSYTAVEQMANTYENFQDLPTNVQKTIIDSAVRFKLAGLNNLDTAIESAALMINSSSFDQETKNILATIPGGYVSIVYQEFKDSKEQTEEFEDEIQNNEIKILELKEQAKIEESKDLVAKNAEIKAKIEEQAKHLDIVLESQTEFFTIQKSKRDERFAKAQKEDPDFPDRPVESNREIERIHVSLKSNGIIGRFHTPLDNIRLYEQAVRHNMPGTLAVFETGPAAKAAALIKNSKTQDPELSPEALILYSKGHTPEKAIEIRRYAINNPNTPLGKLFKTRKSLFDAISIQTKKISGTPLGNEILKLPTTGIGRALKSISGIFGQISDRVGGMNNVIRIASNPLGALKAWAGREIGTYVANKIAGSVAGKAAAAAARKFAAQLLQKSIGRALIDIAAKLGIKLGLSATGVGIPLAVVLVVWDVIKAVFTFVKKGVQKIAVSLFGEKIKLHELVVLPFAGIAGLFGAAANGAGAVLGAIGSATAAAASSAAGIIAGGVAIGVFFYITSIAVAPLISTLVNLQSTPGISGGKYCSQDVADKAKVLADKLQQGFNGYFNKSPDYPEIWNSSLFAANPNPIDQQKVIGGDDMFWCNYLVTKSYEESGKPLRFNFSAMIADFQSQGQYLEAGSSTISDICPGMAVFFSNSSQAVFGAQGLTHVGVVYSVSEDGFTTYESNAPYNTLFYPVDASGNFQNVGTISIASFGSL